MSKLRPRLGLWLTASVIIVLLVLGYRTLRNTLSADPLAELRDSIAVLRTAADSCRADVDAGVAELREFNATLDSMRERVRDLEALDRRGVPIDSYRVYLEAFNAYNDSAGDWAVREDTVRTQDARCRATAQRHNELADSMRRSILARQRGR